MRTLMNLRVRTRDEEGVTLIIVALSLIAMFGMIVLVVDVGGLLFRRREMVNASDAAALAAAKTCVVTVTFDPRTQEEAADEWALENANGVVTAPANIIQESGCRAAESGFVTVEYDAPQSLFFAPVLGFGDNATVATEATAIWGPAGASGGVIPIVLYVSTFQGQCEIPADPDAAVNFPAGESCYFWFDNDIFENSAFGFLDLDDGWDVPADAQCPNVGADDRRDWILGNTELETDPLNYPAATYVCRDSGLAASNWSDLARRLDQELIFPITRCDATVPGGQGGHVDRNGTEVPCTTAPDKYDVIGFVALKLTDILTPNQAAGGSGSCDATRPMSAVPPTTLELDFLGINEGCFVTAPDQITNVEVVKDRPQDPGPEPVLGVDWMYDSVLRQIAWIPGGPAVEGQQYDISFDWAIEGPCGIPPTNNNSGRCVIAETVEFAVGGSLPGQGSGISNVRAIKLCDPAIPGSCDPVPVPVQAP